MILIFTRIHTKIKPAEYQLLTIFTRIHILFISKYICPENKADVFVVEDSFMRVVSASSFSSPSTPKPH